MVAKKKSHFCDKKKKIDSVEKQLRLFFDWLLEIKAEIFFLFKHNIFGQSTIGLELGKWRFIFNVFPYIIATDF